MLEDLRDYGIIWQRKVGISTDCPDVVVIVLTPCVIAGLLEAVLPDAPGHDADVVLASAAHRGRRGKQFAGAGVHHPRDELPAVRLHR